MKSLIMTSRVRGHQRRWGNLAHETCNSSRPAADPRHPSCSSGLILTKSRRRKSARMPS